jgi:hypothetical protein
MMKGQNVRRNKIRDRVKWERKKRKWEKVILHYKSVDTEEGKKQLEKKKREEEKSKKNGGGNIR